MHRILRACSVLSSALNLGVPAGSLTAASAAGLPSRCIQRSVHSSRFVAMPVVGVNRDDLFRRLGRTYTDEEFEELCFEYGIELDDVTSEQEMMSKEHGRTVTDASISNDTIYKIDIPANRYDMLCLEGIARALNVFSSQPSPSYTVADMKGKQMQRLVIKPETSLVRPFAVCAVLRGMTFDPARYASFIDLQDKLHTNICRQRTLVAIGTHDLATVQGPFTYEALPPEDISFVPLKQTRSFNARELMQHYLDNDNKLRKFVPIIHNSVVYPVIYDANRTVLSLPPIINGAHSAISLKTRDVFIECTATDLTKAKIVLNTVVCMFSEYCSTPFEVEPVEVVDAFGDVAVYPDLNSRPMVVPLAFINQNLGLQLSAPEIATLLRKMQLQATTAGSDKLQLLVPPTRSDILHPVDVMEDAAIAYGFNNIPKRIPAVTTQGKELPLNQMSELIRSECAMAGYTEVLTWALVSTAENFTWLRRPDDGNTAVEISNPATLEFEVCRSNLLGSALKTLGSNKDTPLPIRLFEVSDVIFLDSTATVGARNQRRLIAVVCTREGGFEIIHGLLNRIMEVLGVPYEGVPEPILEAKYGGSYNWEPSADPSFFPGRQAKVVAKGQEVGIFGIVHPEVLASFDITHPVSALELNLEPFCFDQFYKDILHAPH